ncbi:MAG: MFS transporter [Rhodobacteraceae bacterium]|jgi:MFS family permease|nr:MFS transporter [Paracoccaceae bacterium]|tara:strand:- start:3171 stop:4346 length:1176 start_codon:yes stop_codon:yes gene_type:complete
MTIKNKHVADIYLNISHFIDHFIMLIFAKAAYDAGREFGLGYEEIIVFGVLGFILFGAAAPIASILANKYSRSVMMVIFHFGIGISAIICSFASTPWELSIGLGLIGVFAAIFHPVGIAMLLKNSKKLGYRLGINGVFGNMGVAAAPLITGFLLLISDWKLSFILPGIACILYGVIFLLALRDEPKAVQTEKTNERDDVFAPQWRRALLALALTTTSGGFIFGAMTFIIPRYFELQLTGITSSVAVTGLIASMVYAIAGFTQIGAGLLIDRFPAKPILFVIGVGQVIFIFLASTVSDLQLFFVTLVATSFVFGQIPIIDTIMSRYIPDKARGNVLSVKFALNLGAGASVLPISSLMLKNGYDLSSLFTVMSFMAMFVVLASLILPSGQRTQ